MRTHPDCLPCFIRQALEGARHVTKDEDLQEKVVREVLSLAATCDADRPPPFMGGMIHATIRRLTGIADPYAEAKDICTRKALDMYPGLEKQLLASPDRLETGIRLAIAGNSMDFALNATVEDALVRNAIDDSMSDDISGTVMEEFRRALAAAGEILYLADNAGETVFDRLLLDQLPKDKITYVVKGAPTINDAVFVDAQRAGITDAVAVIDNGSDMPGTILDTCSESFCRRFDAADMIISKGQGNFESLSDVTKNIFFLFKAKCLPVSRRSGRDVGRTVFIKSTAVETPEKKKTYGRKAH
ncbi:MAG: ARMT1-like domain-containing protein [Pseudomonadota bacterium]